MVRRNVSSKMPSSVLCMGPTHSGYSHVRVRAESGAREFARVGVADGERSPFSMSVASWYEEAMSI